MRHKIPWSVLLALLPSPALILSPVLLLSPTPVWADAIVITRGMLATTIFAFHIEADSSPVELEIGAGDLDAVCNLLPDEIYAMLGHEPAPYIDRLQRFLTEGFLILDAQGQPSRDVSLRLQVRPQVKRDEFADLSEAARRNSRISNLGLTFQEFELLSCLDVLDNILLP